MHEVEVMLEKQYYYCGETLEMLVGMSRVDFLRVNCSLVYILECIVQSASSAPVDSVGDGCNEGRDVMMTRGWIG